MCDVAGSRILLLASLWATLTGISTTCITTKQRHHYHFQQRGMEEVSPHSQMQTQTTKFI
jgi:hypothetical protein